MPCRINIRIGSKVLQRTDTLVYLPERRYQRKVVLYGWHQVASKVWGERILHMHVSCVFIHVNHSVKTSAWSRARSRSVPRISVSDTSGSSGWLLAPSPPFVVDSPWPYRVSGSVDRWSSAAGSFTTWFGVRVKHPPTRLTSSLVLHPHEPAVKWQVVPDGVLENEKKNPLKNSKV